MIKANTKTIKKICASLALIIVFTACIASFSACTGEKSKGKKISILCTVFPQYDWVKNIVGQSDSVEVNLLVKSGTDVHSYSPSVDDMVKIKQSDAVIFIGGESDLWVSDALSDAEGRSLALSEIKGITLREISDEYIFSEGEHSHVHEGADGEGTFDEHIWLSLKNAAAACEAICELICELDSENADIYRENTEKYVEKLLSLDASFSAEVGKANENKLVLFADRFPFVYLFEDYSISYVAAFEGCSTDAQADFETVTRLAKRLSDEELRFIAVTESSDKKLANSVMEAAKSDCEVISFDSMQSVTQKQIDDGYNYLDAMQKNLDSLKKATEKN